MSLHVSKHFSINVVKTCEGLGCSCHYSDAMAALALTNVLLGLGGIGVGIGLSAEERNLMDKLQSKADKLKQEVEESGNLYDHVYYLVSVNLDRLKKSVDRLPTDFVEKIQKSIEDDLKSSEAQKALAVVGQVVGYTGAASGLAGGILQLVRWWKNKSGGQPEREPNPWGDIELNPSEPTQPTEPTPPTVTEEPSSVSKTPKLDKWVNGLSIAGTVFGAASLATTIGFGAWDIEKLKKAIADLDEKQHQISKFQKAMEKVLDELVTAAGLPAKSYDELKKLAATWKEISENFESYSTRMDYAIQLYFKQKPPADVKKRVEEHTDPSEKPFPDDAYPLAKTLADDILVLFVKGKTDKEVIEFFATENPKEGLRFVFGGFFIGSLRDIYDIQKP